MAETTMIGILFLTTLVCCVVVNVDSLTKNDAKYKRILSQDYTSMSSENKEKDTERRDNKYKLVKRLKGDMGSYAMETDAKDNVLKSDAVHDQRPKGYMPYRMRHRYFGGKRDGPDDIVTYENEARGNRFNMKDDSNIDDRTLNNIEKRVLDADMEENNFDIINADNLFQNGRLEDSNYIIIPDDMIKALDAKTKKRDSVHSSTKRNSFDGRRYSTNHDNYHMEKQQNDAEDHLASRELGKERDISMKKSIDYRKLNNNGKSETSEDLMDSKESFSSALSKDRKIIGRQLSTDTAAEWEDLFNNEPADVEMSDEKSFSFTE